MRVKNAYLISKAAAYVALSDKSLVTVFAWAETNADHPLAVAYMGACDGVYGAVTAQESANGTEAEMYVSSLDELAIFYRDMVGREILEMLKLQRRRARRA